MNSKLALYFRVLIVLAAVVAFDGCQHQRVWDSRSYNVRPFDGQVETGYASWYGDQFNGKKTSSGEIYDMYAMTAAHRTAPFGTNVRVTNLDNGQQIVVTINDRGPFVRGRIIDLSKKAAIEIGMMGNGTAKVQLDFMDRKLVPIATSSPTTPSAQPAAHNGSIYIQVASFESQPNAAIYLSDFQRTVPNISARIYKENNLFRIRTGPYPSEESVQSDLATLKKKNFACFVLHSD